MDPQLIYDIGLHKGEDAEFYLKKGFRVVGVEANPDLCQAVADRLSGYVRTGALTLVNKAVARRSGSVRFFVNDTYTEWGTLYREWVDRNEMLGAPSREIEVEAVRFEELLEQFGVPYYLKVDIEGSDSLCLEALINFEDQPPFISIESSKVSMRQIDRELALFRELGYDRFKIVSQSNVFLQVCPSPALEGRYVEHAFERGSSGLFGNELPGEWLTGEEARRRYRRIIFDFKLVGDYGILNRLSSERLRSFARQFFWRGTDWYDTHAMHSSARTD